MALFVYPPRRPAESAAGGSYFASLMGSMRTDTSRMIQFVIDDKFENEKDKEDENSTDLSLFGRDDDDDNGTVDNLIFGERRHDQEQPRQPTVTAPGWLLRDLPKRKMRRKGSNQKQLVAVTSGARDP